ncbi:unnamed protein product [Closterium sp. NIES-64]|nr:unnamed protein product [Closterium sp. NIES-64]
MSNFSIYTGFIPTRLPPVPASCATACPHTRPLCHCLPPCLALLQKLDDITEMAFGGRYVILLMSIFSIYTGFIYNEFFSLAFATASPPPPSPTRLLCHCLRQNGDGKLDDITEMAFGGRYVILLMSIFSIYTGFIYNEFFSLAFDFSLFGGTAYHCRTPDCQSVLLLSLPLRSLASPSFLPQLHSFPTRPTTALRLLPFFPPLPLLCSLPSLPSLLSLTSIPPRLFLPSLISLPLGLMPRVQCLHNLFFDSGTAGLVKDGPTYLFGVDPAWKGSRTELPFLNSLKMKMSIILGVTQMFAGIILSFFNAQFFKKPLNIWYEFNPQMLFLGSLFGFLSMLICHFSYLTPVRVHPADALPGLALRLPVHAHALSVFPHKPPLFSHPFSSPSPTSSFLVPPFPSPPPHLPRRYEFIPQMLFLGSLFGYLSMLIILKWVTGSQADLYHVMIYMFLNPVEPLGDNELFYGQGTVQIVLLFIALIAVPWMLLPKPLILRAQHIQKMAGRTYHALPGSEGEAGANGEEGEGEEEFEFGEVMVHQMIHCIEFVLGAVSNTASYLRLWALSLAHAQLSAVFYERVLEPALASGNVLAILIGSLVFAAATVGVLLLMETLSAFLHALRLHWVEFMNKFYVGDGYQFVPFAFASLPDEED